MMSNDEDDDDEMIGRINILTVAGFEPENFTVSFGPRVAPLPTGPPSQAKFYHL